MFMKISALFFVCILILAISIPVSAAKPEMGEGYFPYDTCPDEGEQYPLYDCGEGLFICEVAEVNTIWKQFSNENDEPLRYWERVKARGGLYEQGNPENFLPYIPLTYTYEYDIVADEATVTGIFAMINVPGFGQIFHDVGRLVAETGMLNGPRLFEAGHHQYIDGDFEAVCEFMR
jgi:hypothetical protein